MRARTHTHKHGVGDTCLDGMNVYNPYICM
jgi:hypothetical protein